MTGTCIVLVVILIAVSTLAVSAQLLHGELSQSRPGASGGLKDLEGMPGGPCLQGVLELLSAWVGTQEVQEGYLIRSPGLQEAVSQLATDPRCSASTCDKGVSTLSWMQYPAWFNGLITDSAMRSRRTSAAFIKYEVHEPPRPYDLPSSADMHRFTDPSNQAESYIFSTADLSGLPLGQVISDGNNFEHLPENACANSVDPTGPLHPRTFLLMWYRTDALAALAAAGAAASADPPDDWEGLLALLAAHQAALAAAGGAAEEAPLPRHGLCLTTNPHCGRLGDVFAAVAASVVQTRGASQGYVFDLAVPPPEAPPLVNGSGWRYAAGLLRALLSYNAPADATSAMENASALGAPYDCYAVSPLFTGGECLVTLEWDAALPHMAAAAALQRPGTLGVAPLPGSRWVAPPGDVIEGTAGEKEPGGATASLARCNRTTCGVSVTHELLYGAYGIYDNGAQPPAAVRSSSCGTAHVPPDGSSWRASTPLETFYWVQSDLLEPEGEAADRAVARRPEQVVNRAPYSAFYGILPTLQFAGMLVTSNASVFMAATGQDQLLALRAARQRVTDAVRSAMGFASRHDSDAQDCAGFAFTRWWSALWAPGARQQQHHHHRQLQQEQQQEQQEQRFDPLSQRNMQPLPAIFNISALTDLGVDSYTARAYLRALWFVMHHPNAAPDVQAASMINWYRWGLGFAAATLLPDSSPPPLPYTLPVAVTQLAAMAQAGADGGVIDGASLPATSANDLLLRLFRQSIELSGNSAARTAYGLSITAGDWKPPPEEMRGTEDEDSHSGLSGGTLVATIIAPQAGLALVVAAVAGILLLRRRRRLRHRDLLGRVRAPRVGPDTTLLITDVQNSTVLWEALSVVTMDAALQLHHSCIRRVLAEHDGYESATEGDSFIVAFACPATAAAFATSCQLALMDESWPQELLDHPDGAVVLVDPREAAAAGHSSAAPLSPQPADSAPHPSAPAVRPWHLSSRFSPATSPHRASWGSFQQMLLLRVSASGSRQTPVCPWGAAAAAARGAGSSPRPDSQLPMHPSSSCSCMSLHGGLRPSCLGPEHHAGAAAIGAAMCMTGDSSGKAGAPRAASYLQRQLSPPPPAAATAAAAGGGSPSRSSRQLSGTCRLGECTESGPEIEQHRTHVLQDSVKDQANSGALTASFALNSGNLGSCSGGSGSTCTWLELLASAYPIVPVAPSVAALAQGCRRDKDKCSVLLADGRIVAFRGLRVRMGLHSGLSDPRHVTFNKVASAYQYSGEFAETSHLVSEAAHGGLVVMSGSAFTRLRNSVEQSRPSASDRAWKDVKVVYAGHHVLKGAGAAAAASAAHHDGSLGGPGGPGARGTVETAVTPTGPSTGGGPATPASEAGSVTSQATRSLQVEGVSPRAQLAGCAAHSRSELPKPTTPPPPASPPPPPQTRTRASSSSGDSSSGSEDTPARSGRVQLEMSGGGQPATFSLNAAAAAPETWQQRLLSGGLQMQMQIRAQPWTAEGTGRKPEGTLWVWTWRSLAGRTLRDLGTVHKDTTRHYTPAHLPQPLYVAVPAGLLCRLALCPPLRSQRVTQLSSLDAPTGCITVVFLKVVGASTLLAELPGPAAQALDQCQRLVCGLLGNAGGYLVEGCGDGLVLAAFGSPAAAVEWALDCVEGLKRLNWDPVLLSHELCSEQLDLGVKASGNSFRLDRAMDWQRALRQPATVLERGLRIKVGLAAGVASHSVNETSGRLSYRGKVMNRAARIAGIAAAGQVLCSGAVWDGCEQADEDFTHRVTGMCLGPMPLKGIREPVAVVQCVREGDGGLAS